MINIMQTQKIYFNCGNYIEVFFGPSYPDPSQHFTSFAHTNDGCTWAKINDGNWFKSKPWGIISAQAKQSKNFLDFIEKDIKK